MSINIKNEETCQLASELAQLTGETMTGAITVALRERLEREKSERTTEARVQRLLAIGRRCAGMLGDGPPPPSTATSCTTSGGCRNDR